jgi:hydroxymethylpyrimidine pyrophosphatase-like HAD family hydrolase
MRENANRRLFITDFDGTLARSDGTIDEADLLALEALGKAGILRAVATGRSLFSFQKAVTYGLPVDYLIFSTGAGVRCQKEGNLLRKIDLAGEAVDGAVRVLLELGVDFMVHHPIPENHRFVYYGSETRNSDFAKRLAIYRDFSLPLDIGGAAFGRAAQLLAVIPSDSGERMFDAIRARLPDLSVVRTTSPLDRKSVWIEMFASGVSKGRTAAWLAERFGIPPGGVLSIGNDYNDLDLLEWSGTSYVVSNAPEDLRRRFQSVASNDRCGVAEAVERWLSG